MKQAWRWLWQRKLLMLVGVVVALLAGLAVFIVVWLPEIQVPTAITPAAERLKLINEYRRTWAGIAGGLFVLLGALVALWRADIARRQVRAMEQGNITERFTRAIDQLGSLKETEVTFVPNIEVRLGGIYGLEQIAKDAPDKYHWQVVEVLTAYVRENTEAYPGVGFVEGVYLVPEDDAAQPPIGPDKPREDVQAALSVIGRLGPTEGQNINLSNRWLKGANLKGAQLRLARLESCNLNGAILDTAQLELAELSHTNLLNASGLASDFRGATLREVNLTEARLEHAQFQGAKLFSAQMNGALLRDVNFQRATLTDSNMPDADLREADLTGAQCIRTVFDRAKMVRTICFRIDMSQCSLDHADMRNADLRRGDLYEANLVFAQISNAQLSGVSLLGANLQSIRGSNWRQLCEAEFDETTTLPDGSTGIPKEQACHAWAAAEQMGHEHVAQFRSEAEHGLDEEKN